MKGKEYKDYWDNDAGVSFIPHRILNEKTDLTVFDEGGVIDEDSIPEHLRGMWASMLMESFSQ